MLGVSAVTTAHVKKLNHDIEEIRIRALDTIISKFNLGYGCNCDVVRKELIIKLFNWFTFPTVPCPEKVLDLLLTITKENNYDYATAFGKQRFKNEIRALKSKLDSKLHNKVDQIEEVLLSKHFEQTDRNKDKEDIQISSDRNLNWDNYLDITHNSLCNNSHGIQDKQNYDICSPLSLMTRPFDVMDDYGNETILSGNFQEGIKWFVMPWQPIVHSDKGIFLKVEENLNYNTDIKVFFHMCEFIINIILQDFPAEVFLQRPAIISILHAFLQSKEVTSNVNKNNILKAVLQVLNKLTRSLRFRIYYYCDPCVANKKQKLLMKDAEYMKYPLSECRDTPIGGLPEINYNAYQSTATSDKSHSIDVTDNIDESVLQLQQMPIPTYCIESLTYVTSLLCLPNNPSMPLTIFRYVTDVAHELVRLLVDSLMPTIWLCNDGIATKIQEDLKLFLKQLGEIIQYFNSYSNVDYSRIIYLHLLYIAIKLLSSIVPLELADSILPKSLKMSICFAIMDASIYLMYPVLHSTLQEYARYFHGTDESNILKLYDETHCVVKSMKASISIMKNPPVGSPREILTTMYTSISSLPYHKNVDVLKIYVNFLKRLPEYKFSENDLKLATKLTLRLLANEDVEVQRAMYTECYTLVKAVLGVQYTTDKYTFENISFLLFGTKIIIEIICYGCTSEVEEIRNMAEEILIYTLKGKICMGEEGWNKYFECLLPCLPLLQCYSDSCTSLGKCITKMLDPDVSPDIRLPYIEVLKGNTRLLYSSDSEVRKEAVYRLIWLLEKEKDSLQKLPRLSTLHNFPLSSICIVENKAVFKWAEGNYSRNSFISVLEMLKTSTIEPKIKKSALVQISVMMTDTTLHKVFTEESALSIILDIFSGALVEKDYFNYPDCVVPILTILKLICLTDSTVRFELSSRTDVLMSILRSLFLYHDNECVKIDASQLLCMLLYHDFILKTKSEVTNKCEYMNISLPHIITMRMRLPFKCKSHWKVSIHRCSNVFVLLNENSQNLTFVRQFWAWEWNDGIKMLWQELVKLNDSKITDNLKIQAHEFDCMKYSSPYYCCQQQLHNVQNSITHDRVICAIDYLMMYLKLYHWLKYENFEDVHTLPWIQSFERFLVAHPTNDKDYDMSVNMLTFLYFYINLNVYEESNCLRKNVKSLKKLITQLLPTLETKNENMHQWTLKLARACFVADEEDVDEESSNQRIKLIDYIIVNLCSEDQQHFYKLAYLNWLLVCLIYLINMRLWQNHKSLLICLGNALIELIVSFHSEGTVRFMGLSITRNSVICLNEVLHLMQVNVEKQKWCDFWYGNGRSLNWLPMLWRNRDPLVRASGLQVLAGLISGPHTATQLLNAIILTPSDLCRQLFGYITSREECCIVKEEACIALSNIIKNCGTSTCLYMDSLKGNVLVLHAEQSNVYYEISLFCSNYYSEATLDVCSFKNQQENDSAKSKASPSKTSTSISGMPQNISELYGCSDEIQNQLQNDSNNTYLSLIATPSLITASCNLLNNLISVGQHEVVQRIYECSLHKYFFRCFNNIPKIEDDKKDYGRYRDILEMNATLCTVLTNCVIHSPKFASKVMFPPDVLSVLFSLLNKELYYTHTPSLECLRNKLWTEIYNFLATLSLTDNQNFETIQTVLELCRPETVLFSIYDAMRSTNLELQKSSIAFLAFLLAQDIQRDAQNEKNISLKLTLDKTVVEKHTNIEKINILEILSSFSKQSPELNARKFGKIPMFQAPKVSIEKPAENLCPFIGAEMCKILSRLYVAHIYAQSKRNCKQSKDKDLIIAALTNLLCISKEAKKLGIEENLPQTLLFFLKELYVKLSQQSQDIYNRLTEHEKKTYYLFHDLSSIFILLMNFMYQDEYIKAIVAKAGLADSIHKLWTWICLNKNVKIACLKLLATFTTNCEEATQTLPLTTTVPGVGLRKTPNTIALIHVLIHLIIEKIEKAGRNFEHEILVFSFHILRNAVHNHECRVAIAKSNLLQFFTKIHPLVTKRGNPWPLIEIYCLEFLIDYTYYEEGQTSVSKATEGMDVLIRLAKSNTIPTRVLALSTLRNLAFNVTNRPRLLTSVDFMNLLHTTIKNNTVSEIAIASSTLWSLISNNQKAKLMVRTAGFLQCLQEALGKLSLTSSAENNQEMQLIKMLQYIIQIMSPSETYNEERVKKSPL